MRAGFQWERLARVRFFTLPFSRKDSRRRMAGGDLRLGMVEMYIPTYLSYKFAMSTEKVISHDYNIEPKRNLTPAAIATYLDLWKGRSIERSAYFRRSSRMRGKSTRPSGSSCSAFLTNISHRASCAAGRSFNRYIASVRGGHTVAKGSCKLFKVDTHC